MALTILYSTDAIRRYLLEQYGVAPQDLRDLGGSVRIGDVLYIFRLLRISLLIRPVFFARSHS